MEKPLTTLSERIVSARSALGVGQDVIAKLARMSQQSYSDLETGKSKGTTKIGSLARALQVDAYWLETGRDDPPPPQIADAHPRYSVSPECLRALELITALPDRKRKALIQLLED